MPAFTKERRRIGLALRREGVLLPGRTEPWGEEECPASSIGLSSIMTFSLGFKILNYL